MNNLKNIKSDCLKPLAEAFAANLDRTATFAMMPVEVSFSARYVSVVLESWFFFEAFAADLWAAGVDNGTRSISDKVTANTKWEKSEMLASSIPADVTADSRTQPGTYRREIGLVSFQKLRSLKTYFKIAFGDSVERLVDDTAGGYINALSGVRNCIAHAGGKVDGQFKQRCGSFPEFNSLNIGDKIQLDGALVKKLRNASIETAAALLHAVDDILAAGV